MSNKLKTKYKIYWQMLTLLVLATLYVSNIEAKAEPRAVDVFSINSKTESNSKSSTTLQNSSGRTPIVIWFEQFDRVREQHRPSEKDKIILTRPLTQDATRVQQWTNTASKVSKDYLIIAKSVRNLAVPPGMSDVKEYRDLVADWFQDSAQIYIDLIRPRPPAKTVEDLDEQLNAVKSRAEGLASTIKNLQIMDRDIRKSHKVPIEEDDAVQKFAKGKS